MNFDLKVNKTAIKQSFSFLVRNTLYIFLGFLFLLIDSQAFAQFQYKQKLVAPDRAFGDNFGIYSTDIEDSLMITGSFWNDLDENGINVLSNAGAAYIYSLNNTGNWTFHQKLVSNPRNIDDNFGRTVLLYNDFAFVASTNAYFDTLGNDSTPGAGLVFVFKKNNVGNYVQTQILQGVHRNKSALFGFSLEAHNNYLYVGSVGDSADATNSTFAVSAGSVNIFNYNQSSDRWEFKEKMVAYDRDGSDQFGYNIKVNDNTLVIAATTDEHDSAGTFIGGGVGSIYVYRNDGGNWVWEDKISTNDGSSNDRLGESMGLSDGYIAASATGVDTDSSGANPITNNGAVYTFKRSPSGNWFQTDKVTEPIRQNGDFFGYHISLDGETLISSAFNEDEDENGINTISAAGALYVYKRQSNENWKFSQKIVEPNRQIADQMGRGLAYRNGYLLASAPGEKLDENELNSLSAAGAVFVFYDSTLAPVPIIPPDTSITFNENSSSDTILDLNLLVNGSNITFSIDSFEVFDEYIIKGNYLALKDYANLDAEISTTDKIFISYYSSIDSGQIVIDINLNDLSEPVYAGFGNAFNFDGVDDYAEFSRVGLPGNKEPKTIGVWIKPNGLSNSIEYILNFGQGYANIATSGGDIYYFLSSNSISSANTSLIANRWHFITMVFDTTYIKTYINGQFNNQSNLSSSNFQFASNTEYNLNIGRDPSGTRDNFNGGIDEITIWNRTLTDVEIYDLYENGPQLSQDGLVSYINFNEINTNLVISNLNSQELDTIKNGNSLNIIQGPSPGTFKSGTFSINKTFTTSDTIGYLFSYDQDRSNPTFSLLSGGQNSFSISPNGIVTISNQSIFDTLSGSSYSIDFSVVESGDNQTDSGTFSITLNSFLGPKSLPFYQNFEGDSNIVNVVGDNANWKRWTGASQSFYGGAQGAYEGAYYLYLPGDYSEDSAIFEMPYLDFSSATNPYLSFKYYVFNDYNLNRLFVEIEMDNSGNWVTIFDTSAVFADIWNTANLDLTPYSSASLLRVRFTASNRDNYNEIAIDDIVVANPSNLDVALMKFQYGNCFSNDSIELQAVVRNYSTTALSNFTINTFKDGVFQSNQNITGSIPPLSNTLVDLGTFSESAASLFSASVNTSGDNNNFNDSITAFFDFITPSVKSTIAKADSIKISYDLIDPNLNWFAKITNPISSGLTPIDSKGNVVFFGLSANTGFTINLIEICNSDTLIALTSTVFSECRYINPPLFESFENTTCYEIIPEGISQGYWKVVGNDTAQSETYSINNAQDKSNFLFYDTYWGSSNSNSFYSPFLDLRSTSNLELSFFYNNYYSGGLKVQVDTSNSGNWITILDSVNNNRYAWDYFNYEIPNSFYTDSFRVQFIGSGTSIGPSIDNIQLKQKPSANITSLRLSEGLCYNNDNTPFSISAKNTGSNAITSYQAFIYKSDSTLILSKSDSNLTIGADSIFSIDFDSSFTKLNNNSYYSLILTNGDTILSDNYSLLFYTSESVDLASYSGSVSLELNFELPGLLNHSWLVELLDSTGNQLAIIDTNNQAYFFGLTQETTYTIKVYELCSGDTILESTEYATTSCSYKPLPYFQDFSDNEGCFEIIPGAFDWFVSSFNSDIAAATLASFDGPAGDTAFLYLPFLNTTLNPNPKLYFDYALSSIDPVNLIIQVDTIDNNNWTTLASIINGTDLNWNDTSISLSGFISDSTKIRFGAIKVVAGSSSRRDYYKLDNVNVFGDQPVDYNFVGFQHGENCAYQDSLDTKIIFHNAGTDIINGLTLSYELGKSNAKLNQSTIFFSDTILPGDTALLSLGNLKSGYYHKVYSNHPQDLITNNNQIEDLIENPFGISAINISNDSATVDFAISSLGNDSLQFVFDFESFNNQENLFDLGNNIINFQKTNPQVIVSGLSAGMNYKIQVREKCNGIYNNYFLDFDNISNRRLGFKSACSDTISFGYFETFDYDNANFSNTGCFSLSTGNNHERWYIDDYISTFNYGPSTPLSEPNYLLGRSSSSSAGDTMVIYTPYLDLTTTQTPLISFNYSLFGNDVVNLVFQGESASGWETLFSVSGDQGPDWKYQSLFLPEYRNQITRFRFISEIPILGNQFAVDPAIDNFSVDSASSIEVVLSEGIPPYTDLLSLDYLISNTVPAQIIINNNSGPFGMAPSQPGSNVDFAIISGNIGGNFRIDSTTNVLQTNKTINLNKESGIAYQIQIEYTSNGGLDTLPVDFTLQNEIEPVFAGLGSAIRIETTDQFVYNGKIVPDGTPHTVAFWMKNKSQPFNPEIINFGNFKLDYSGTDLEFNGIGNIGQISDTGWIHIAQTFQTSRTILYVNGTPIDTNAAFTSSYSNNYLGNPSGQNTGDGFRFDDLILWKKPLKQSEIRNLMVGNFNSLDTNLVAYYDMNYSPNSSTLIDRTGNGFDLVALGETYAKVQRSVDTIVVYVENTALANDSISRYFNFDPDSNNIAFASFNDTSGNFILDTANNLVRLSPTADLSQISFNSFAFSYGIQESGDNQIGVVNYLVNVISLPNLPNQNLLIDENWPVGDTITTAAVVNPDSNITYVYKIVGGNIDSSFGIDSLSGNLFVAKNDSIDAEYYSLFELLIEAKSLGDSSFVDTSIISINVNDLVEPIFVGFNNAVSLNGTNQYLESQNTVIPNSGNFSLSIWAKQNTPQTSAFNIVSQTSNFNTSNKRFYLGANNTGEIKIGDDWLNTGVQFPSDLKWHNYTFVKSPTEVVLYIDGDSVATKTINYANPDLPSFKIGVQFSGISEFFNGYVDELKVWNTNLTKDQVRQTIIDNPTELDTTLELYYNFDEVSNLVVDLSGNNKNATLLNYSNPTNAYLSSTDTLIVFVQELASDTTPLFTTKAFDFDNSQIQYEFIGLSDSIFTINPQTGVVYLLPDTNFNFEENQNHTITIKATEQGDNQTDSVTYLIKVLDQPEPINTDLEIAFFGTFGKGYEYIPQAQKVKNLFSTIKNNGPDSVLNFYLILDDGISVDSIFVDTLLPNSSKEFSFSVSATGLTNGTYSYTNYIFTDTFDLNPSNDSLNIILTINDTLLAKSIVEDSTDTDIYLEFKPGVSSLQLNQKTATKLYLNQGDTLTNIALYLEGISVGDSILLELLTLKNNLPDSLLEQQIISFADTTWGFKNFNLNCFNYLDSGTYALAIGKVNQNNSNIRFATSSSYFDSTSIFFTDTSGNWFQAQAASFASMPLINFSFKSTYNYPNLIVGGDTLLCAGDLQLLQAEVGIDTVLFGYSFKANAIYSGFAERYFAASYTDGNGCFFYDSVYVINQQLSPFIFDSIIGCADSLILRANPTWDAYNWFNGATDDTTKVIAPAEGFNKYFLSAETNEGCIAEDTLVALINPLPTVNLNNIGPFCNNEVDFIIDTSFYSPVGGAFSSGGPINGDTILVSQAFLGVLDSITYSFTDTNGCFNQTSTPLEIKVAPTASLNFVTVGLDSICANEVDTVLRGGLPNYGFYKGIGVINGNLFSPDSVVTTASTITFIADSTNGCSDSAIASINLVTPPNIDSLKLTPLCLNDSIVALDGGFPIGGFYRGNGVSNDNFDPLVTSTGMQPITYVLQNNFGCFDSLSTDIEVYGLPTAIFSGLPILCNNDTALNLAPFVNDTNNIYQFSGSGISGDYFNPFLISADTFDLIYQVTDSNFCSKKDTSAIVVLAPPIITLTTPSPICDYDTINLFNVLTPSPLGGNFKGSFVSDSLFKADTANTYNLRYVISDTSLSKTCSDSSLFNLTVNPAPIVNFNLSQNRVCVDQSNILLSGATPAGNSGIYTGTSINKISNQYFFYPPSADTGLHVITYTFTTSNGCVAEDKDTLRVDSLPSISISTIPSICAGDDTLNLNTFGFPLGGIFSGGAVFTDSVNYFFIPDSASIGVSNLVNYDYTDSITGCSNSSNSLITLNQIPALSFASLPSFCEDDTAFLISQYSPVGGIFLGNGITVDTINNQYYFHPDSVSVGIQTLTYQYTDNNGCTNSTQRSTNLNALPAVNLSLQGTPIDTLCLITTPQSFPLTFATPIGGQYSGKNVSFNTYNLNISSAGTDTVYYTYTNPTTGCVASDTSTLELINLPQVNFNLITDSICNNASVISIGGGTSTSAISQSFYSGPGVSNGNFNPNSLTPGIYNINYVVIDSIGCSDSASQNITVHPVPSISYNTIAPICLNDSTIINANTSGATFWKFSILNPSTNVLNQTTGLFHSNQTGIDSVQFLLVDANGCADSLVQTINVDTLPNVTLGNFNDVCRNGIPINLNTGTPIGGTYFYNGSAVTGSLSPNTLGAGSHKIIYRFTDLNSCTSIDSNNITVNLPPPITLSSLPKVCTDGSAITLNQGNPQGGIYSAAQGMLNDSVFDPTIVLAGSYNIQYSYTDTNGCDSSLTGSLVVNPLPLVNFKNLIPSLCTNSDSIFIRDSVNFPALPPRGYFTGKGIDSTGWFNPYVAWIGGHNITYHYTDTNNCSNSTTTSIIVNGLPAPILSQNEVQICLGDTAILEAQGGIEFLWETGDTTAIIRVSPDSFKTYSVTVTDGLNCSNIGSIDQDVYNSFFVKANLDSVTTNLNTPLTVDLLANDNGNITKYKILDGPFFGTIDESFNPDLDYTPDPGFRRYDSLTYELCDDFCPIVCDTGMVKIQVFGNPNEFIPNGFSPNGDGTNDTWTVPGIELYPNNELIILNRWGSVVYQAAPYNNDWAGESGGNFSFGSDRLPDGTYFYILKLDKDSNTEGLTGSIEMRSKL